jgi:hypothetical protein
MSCESCGSQCACGSSSEAEERRLDAAVLSQVLLYKNEAVVDRYMRKLKLSRLEALRLFRDVKRFLWMYSISKESISPPLLVDLGWHHFILFTEDYQDFCKEYFGYFIHHRPQKPGEKSDGGASVKRTLDLLRTHFIIAPTGNWRFQEERECGT